MGAKCSAGKQFPSIKPKGCTFGGKSSGRKHRHKHSSTNKKQRKHDRLGRAYATTAADRAERMMKRRMAA